MSHKCHITRLNKKINKTSSYTNLQLPTEAHFFFSTNQKINHPPPTYHHKSSFNFPKVSGKDLEPVRLHPMTSKWINSFISPGRDGETWEFSASDVEDKTAFCKHFKGWKHVWFFRCFFLNEAKLHRSFCCWLNGNNIYQHLPMGAN